MLGSSLPPKKFRIFGSFAYSIRPPTWPNDALNRIFSSLQSTVFYCMGLKFSFVTLLGLLQSIINILLNLWSKQHIILPKAHRFNCKGLNFHMYLCLRSLRKYLRGLNFSYVSLIWIPQIYMKFGLLFHFIVES